MPVQKNLFPEAEPAHAPPPEPRPPAAPLWLQRISLFILVLFCVYLGVIVAVLPWWTSVWDHNLFLQSHPHLWGVLRLGFVRGIISGLGVLDIWIGISEAIHYRDQRA
jgi:hypothetical protein